MARCKRFALAAVLLLALHCSAQMPSVQAFEAAVDAARPLAAAHGLSLRTDGLWLELLRSRSPLLAQRQGAQCLIGYTAYTPGRRYDSLFPALPAEAAALWLAAIVHHELAHCLEDASHAIAKPDAAVGSPAQRQREALADLAFALYLDAHSPQAAALIALMAQRRAQAAASDPDHDTASVLACYLEHPARRSATAGLPAQWAATVAVWAIRCPL
jgi:hypothetical protein